MKPLERQITIFSLAILAIYTIPAVAAPPHHKKIPVAAHEQLSLSEAAMLGDVPAAQAALKRGAFVDQQDDTGDTPLIKAVSEAHLAVVKLLLTHKASVNIEDYAGLTAFDFTAITSANLSDHEIDIRTQIADLITKHGGKAGDGNQTIFSTDHHLIAHVSNFDADPANDTVHVLEGNITNRTRNTISYAEISANFDNDGTVVDSGLSNVQNLEAGQTWHFKIITLDKGASGYKLTKLFGN